MCVAGQLISVSRQPVGWACSAFQLYLFKMLWFSVSSSNFSGIYKKWFEVTLIVKNSDLFRQL